LSDKKGQVQLVLSGGVAFVVLALIMAIANNFFALTTVPAFASLAWLTLAGVVIIGIVISAFSVMRG